MDRQPRSTVGWRWRTLTLTTLFLARAVPASAGVLMQAFYWDVPSPAAGSPMEPWWWDRLARQANALRRAGVTAVWIPPVLKCKSGGYSVGYDPFDDYDLGSKNQQGTIPTRYGTREQLERCVGILRANGLDVYVDVVDNHRNGDDGTFHFFYADAFGHPKGGRFQKGPFDFHPNVPQDPNVFDDGHEDSFGRDLAPVNGGAHYAFDGLLAAGDWLTKALDIQGYRLDYVKGISSDFLRAFLNHGAMGGKFAVGEFRDGDLGRVSHWVHDDLQNRCSALDFPLRDRLADMCRGHGFFPMGSLDHAGLAGQDPFRAVTFVESHDSDHHADERIVTNKALGYAYILTSEGYPCVFYRDYSTEPGCYGMKPALDPLIWIHEKIADGPTVERWKDDDVFAYERTAGNHLLVGLNDNESSNKPITVATGFGPNQRLHDYTGHRPDVQTDAGGRASITIPKDDSGAGYVCYSRVGQSGSFAVTNRSVTQEYAGAADLDIPPADTTAPVTVCRIWSAAGKPIEGSLYFDSTGWTPATRLVLELFGPSGTRLANGTYTPSTTQGTAISATAGAAGWYRFQIRAADTPPTNPKPAYWLKTTYTAPLKLQ